MKTSIVDGLIAKAKAIRTTLTWIERDDFLYLYNGSTPERKEKIEALVADANIEALKAWMNQELGNRSCKELKGIAQGLFIPNWSRMRKSELEMEINGFLSRNPGPILAVNRNPVDGADD